jgi:hypothetical protein
MEENESLSGIQAEEVVTPQSGDAAEQGSEGEQSSGGADRGQQSHDDNKRYQAARRSGEQAGYERAMKEVNDRIARGRMRDPNTGEEIDSLDKLDAYTKAVRTNRIQSRAKAEGKSVAQVTEEEDTRDWIAEQRRRQKAEEKKPESQQDFIARDLQDFRDRHPEADISKLDNNKAFRRFCGSRYGKEPLADLYEDYLEIAGEREAAALARAESKSSRATGSGGGSGAETLTASQQRDLDEWNRNYPNMKMTAKEFLSRG